MKTTSILLALSMIWVASSDVAGGQQDKTISPQARAYIEDFFKIIKEKSLRTKEVDWDTLRRRTFENAVGAQEPVDTYEAIRFALHGLGDHHSFLQLSEELSAKEAARREVKPAEPAKKDEELPTPFQMRRRPEGFVHKVGDCLVPQVVVPLKPFAEIEVMNAYAAILYKFIVEADANNPCGWIVDLRGNGGGAVFPMLAGVGILLGEGDLSYALDANGGKTAFFYRNGQSGVRDPSGKEEILTQIAGPLYRIKKQLPIAVLIDKGTGSSGETMAVAFRARANTRFFGVHTAGSSTSTEGFHLSDGANVVLATGVDVDRNGRVYPDGIAPDEIVPSGNRIPSEGKDPVIKAALKWISKSRNGK